MKTGVDFETDFFTLAIEANVYPVVFYLRYKYEEQIFHASNKILETHINSYTKTPHYLKAKIFLSKSLLPIFCFK